VHFFEDQNDSPHVHHLGFTQTGGMENWPQGFFDQYQIDVSALGRIRRRE
jgi:predicted ATPase